MKTYAWIVLVIALLGFTVWYSNRQYQAGVDATRAEYEADKNKATDERLAGDAKALKEARAELADKQMKLRDLERKVKHAQDPTGCYRDTPMPDDAVDGMRQYLDQLTH